MLRCLDTNALSRTTVDAQVFRHQCHKAGLQQMLRYFGISAARALITARQPQSGEMDEESTVFISEPEDDNLLSTVIKSNGIPFRS